MGEPEKISIIGNMTRFMKLICFTVLLCGLSRSSSLSNDFDTAVKKGDVEMVKPLLDETESKKLILNEIVNLLSLSNDFDTAVKKGEVEMVRLLLAETESK